MICPYQKTETNTKKYGFGYRSEEHTQIYRECSEDECPYYINAQKDCAKVIDEIYMWRKKYE